jgi:hypothetical protein
MSRALTILGVLLISAAPLAAQQPCTTDASQIVADLYKQVLERSPDAASAGMTQRLAAHRVTVADLVREAVKSSEHAQRFLWPPVVAAAYRDVMGRAPTQDELRYDTIELAAGRKTVPALIAQIATRASSNEQDAVRILYRRLLGRDPDPQGLHDFTQLAERQGIGAVAQQIVNSPEYDQRVGTSGLPSHNLEPYQDAVRVLYRHMLGSTPDPIGLQAYAEVGATSGFNAVVDQIIASPAYQQSFGDDTVPGLRSRFCR